MRTLGKTLSRFGVAAALLVGSVAAADAIELKATSRGWGSPGRFFELLLELDPPPEGERVRVRLGAVQSPAQNFVIEPNEIRLSTAGTADTKVKVSGPGDLYGVWTFEASALIRGRRVSDRFQVKFPLRLEQRKAGERVEAPVGSEIGLAGIRVINHARKGVAGIPVQWEARGPLGQARRVASSGRVTTGPNGEVTLPFAAKVPGKYDVVAELAKESPVFLGRASFLVDTPLTLEREGSERQRGLPSEDLPQPLAVSVVDSSGKAVSGIAIEWRTTKAPGGAAGTTRLTPANARTTEDGISRTEVAVGEKVGTYRVQARPKEPGIRALAKEAIFFTIQTPSGKELEDLKCGEPRAVLPRLTQHYREKSAAYHRKVKELQEYEKAKKADLRRLDGVFQKMYETAESMKDLDRKLERIERKTAVAMAWSAFLNKFGNDLLKVAIKAREADSGEKSPLTKPALTLVKKLSHHYGPQRAQEKWENAVALHRDLQADRERMGGHLKEMNDLRRERRSEYRSQAEMLADEVNKLADETNAAAQPLREELKKYRGCERQLKRAGVESGEIYGNWPGGQKDYERYVKKNFPVEKTRVRTAGWERFGP